MSYAISKKICNLEKTICNLKVQNNVPKTPKLRVEKARKRETEIIKTIIPVTRSRIDGF